MVHVSARQRVTSLDEKVPHPILAEGATRQDTLVAFIQCSFQSPNLLVAAIG